MEDGGSMKQDVVFSSRKGGCIRLFLCRYIIKSSTTPYSL